MEQHAHLRLVPPADLPAVSERSERGDIGLLVFFLTVSAIPIGGTLMGGRWGDGSVGLATAVSFLCVRELVHELRARRVRARR